MGRPWKVIELDDEDIDEYGAENLPGMPNGYMQDSLRNFVVEHEDYGFIGHADLFEGQDHYILMNCEINSQHRGLSYDGKSVFEDLIETRLAETDGMPVRTDAVTDHGKTQYKMSQYGFRPLMVDPHPSPHSPPMIEMWRGSFEDPIVNLPERQVEAIREAGNGTKPIIGNGEGSGLEYEKYQPFGELEEGLQVYRVQRGEKNPEEVVDEILDDRKGSERYAVNVIANPRFPETEQLAEGLGEEGFDFLGFRPPYGNMDESVTFGRFNRDIYQISATDESIELMETLGLEFSLEEEGEKSSNVTLLS